MGRLFDMSNEFSLLFDRFDEINELIYDVNEDGEPIDAEGNVIDPVKDREERLEAWFEELSGIEDDFKFKAENIAQYIKHLKAESDEIDKEIKELRSRKDQRDKKIESMKKYLLDNMNFINLKKIDGVRAKLSIRKNAPSLKIENELEFITMLQNTGRDDLLKYSMPEVRKTEVKNLIKNGEVFDGASIESSESLIIK